MVLLDLKLLLFLYYRYFIKITTRLHIYFDVNFKLSNFSFAHLLTMQTLRFQLTTPKFLA